MKKSIHQMNFNRIEYMKKAYNILRCSFCGDIFSSDCDVYIIQDPFNNKIEIRHEECLEENLK